MKLAVPNLSQAIGNNKWVSEDPNILSRQVNELKNELGLFTEKGEGKKPKSSLLTVQKLKGDAKLIDGPDDYAFNKLSKQGQAFVSPNRYLRPPVYPNYPLNNYPSSSQYAQQTPYSYHHPHGHGYPPNYYPSSHQAYPPQDSHSYIAPQQPYYDPYYSESQVPVQRGRRSDQMSWHSQEYPRHPYPTQNYYPQQYYPHPVEEISSSKYRKQEGQSQYLSPPQAYQEFENRSGGSKNSQGKASRVDPRSSHESGEVEHDPNDEYITAVSGNDSNNSKTNNQLKRFKQLIEAKSSNILHVKGLDNQNMTAELLNSLFGNFGNIMKILFVKPKKAAFIVYESQELATIAKEMLSNLGFMDCHLKVIMND